MMGGGCYPLVTGMLFRVDGAKKKKKKDLEEKILEAERIECWPKGHFPSERPPKTYREKCAYVIQMGYKHVFGLYTNVYEVYN